MHQNQLCSMGYVYFLKRAQTNWLFTIKKTINSSLNSLFGCRLSRWNLECVWQNIIFAYSKDYNKFSYLRWAGMLSANVRERINLWISLNVREALILTVTLSVVVEIYNAHPFPCTNFLDENKIIKHYFTKLLSHFYT